MDPDLVHSARVGPTEDDAGSPVKAEPLEIRVAILAVRADLADTNLVAHHFDGLLANNRAPVNKQTNKL